MLDCDAHARQALLREAAALAQASRHPNVASFLGAARHDNELWSISCRIAPASLLCTKCWVLAGAVCCRLVLEFVAQGSLFDAVGMHGRLKGLPHRLRLMAEAAAGLIHLHSRAPPVIHRSIMLRNIFVDSGDRVKVRQTSTACSSLECAP